MKKFVLTMVMTVTVNCYASCWLHNYGYCQESLDWDSPDAADYDLTCQQLAEDYCKGKISKLTFESRVESLK